LTIALALKTAFATELAFHNSSSGKSPGSARITSSIEKCGINLVVIKNACALKRLPSSL
jgi:hypothetical protein